MEEKDLVLPPNPQLPTGTPPPQYVSKYKQTYTNPTPGHLPLIGIGNEQKSGNDTSDSGSFRKSYLATVKDTGVNGVQSIVGDVPSSLTAGILNCDKTGIRQTVRMGAFKLEDIPEPIGQETENSYSYKAKLDKLYAKEKEEGAAFQLRWENALPSVWPYKAASSYQLFDEPSVRDFKWAARVKDQILETDTWNTLIFDNLLPKSAKPFQFSGRIDGYLTDGPNATKEKVMDYAAYLNEYQRVFRPAVWCFDCYSLQGTGILNKPVTLKLEYFENLQMIRDKAYADNRPFWATVRTLYTPISDRSDEN